MKKGTMKHHDGKSLKPVSKFKAEQSPRGHIPMKAPRRTKHFHGRGGGIRKGAKRY